VYFVHPSTDISVDIAADSRPIRWPLIIGGISVDYWWSISRLSYTVLVKSNKWSIINAAFWLVELVLGYMLLTLSDVEVICISSFFIVRKKKIENVILKVQFSSLHPGKAQISIPGKTLQIKFPTPRWERGGCRSFDLSCALVFRDNPADWARFSFNWFLCDWLCRIYTKQPLRNEG